MDVQGLTAPVAAWLNAILPEGASASADQIGTILISWPLPEYGAGFGQIAVQPEVELRDGFLTALNALLGGLQHYIPHNTTEPWPPVPGHPTAMPEVRIEVASDGTIAAGYEYEGRWVLRGPPLAFPPE